VLIRDADPARDAAACAAIYAPFVRDTAVSFEEVPPTSAEMGRLIQTVSARYPWLVAEDAGRVVGFAYASSHRLRAAYRWAVDVTVYIDEQNRGKGLGKQLYARLFDLLTRQGIRTAVAGITMPNPASVGLHESLGFELVGVYRGIGFKAGAWRDVGWWQRRLVEPGAGPPEDPGPPVRAASDA
jgi:L-amino acid N-acyltransferase YncA